MVSPWHCMESQECKNSYVLKYFWGVWAFRKTIEIPWFLIDSHQLSGVDLQMCKNSYVLKYFWGVWAHGQSMTLHGIPEVQKRQATEHFRDGANHWCASTGKVMECDRFLKFFCRCGQPWKCQNGKCSLDRCFLTFSGPNQSTFEVFDLQKYFKRKGVAHGVVKWSKHMGFRYFLDGVKRPDKTWGLMNSQKCKTVMF